MLHCALNRIMSRFLNFQFITRFFAAGNVTFTSSDVSHGRDAVVID